MYFRVMKRAANRALFAALHGDDLSVVVRKSTETQHLIMFKMNCAGPTELTDE